MTKLTIKQKRFADEYIISGNATEAAIKAGYSEKTANRIASENLSKLDIKDYIDERLKEIEASKFLTIEEALKITASIARGEPREIETIDIETGEKYTKKVYPNFKDSNTALDHFYKINGSYIEKRELHYRAYTADELFEVESTSLLKEHLSKFYSVEHQGFSREQISEFFNDVYNLGELDFPGAPEEFKNVNILLAKRDISRILFEHGDQMSNEEFNLIFSLSDQVDEVLLMNDRKENSIMVYKNIPGKDDRVMEAIIIKKERGGHIIHFMKTSRRRQRKIEKKYKKLFNSTE